VPRMSLAPLKTRERVDLRRSDIGVLPISDCELVRDYQTNIGGDLS
jgi:hypothetical protein